MSVEVLIGVFGAIQALALGVIVPLVKARFRGLDEKIADGKKDLQRAEGRLLEEIHAHDSRHREFYKTFEGLKIDMAEIKAELKIIRRTLNGDHRR